EPSGEFEEVADSGDKKAQCSASESGELRLEGYAESDLEPARTCGADRIATQSWPAAQPRAVADVVNTSWSMRANPGETPEHATAHDRSMKGQTAAMACNWFWALTTRIHPSSRSKSADSVSAIE